LVKPIAHGTFPFKLNISYLERSIMDLSGKYHPGRIIGLLALGFFIVTSACSTFQKTGTSQKDEPAERSSGMVLEGDSALRELSDEKQIEYEFKFVEATKLRLLGQSSEALQLFEECSKLHPHAPDPYYQMSMIAKKISENRQALDYAKKAVQYGPDNKWYRLHLANLHLEANNQDSALMQYEYIAETQRVEDLDILFRLARLNQRQDNYEEALRYYDRIEGQVGFNRQLAVLKKMIYTRLGNKEKAVEEVQKLVDHYPDNTRYIGMLAELYASFEEYDKADQMYDKLFSLDSTNNLGQLSLVKYYNQQQKYDRALELLRKQVIPNPNIDYRDKMLMLMKFIQDQDRLNKYQSDIGAALDSLSKYHANRNEVHALYADYYLKRQEYRSSIEHLKTLAEQEHSQYIYWDQLLSVYSITSQFKNMYRFGQKAIERYPNRPRIYLLTGIGANQLNKADSALKLLNEGLSYVGNDNEMKTQFDIHLAEAYYKKGNYPKTWKHYDRVLKKDPDNIMVLNNYSYYLSQQDTLLNRAERYIKKVIKKKPEDAIYLDTYAWVLYKKGKYGRARQYIQKAIKFGGFDDADVVEHYGDILFKTGNVNQAVEQWEKSQSLGNRSDQIQYKIDHQQLPPDGHKD